jgi:type I restriction enzyme S subunit
MQIIPKGDFRFCLGRRTALIRPDPSQIDHRYLFYYFFSPRWRAQVEANTLTGATVDRIPLTTFPDFDVFVPDLREQGQIAEILSDYDELIATNQRRIKLLEESARLLYREWFIHLRFPGHESVPVKVGLPLGWRRQTLGSLCDSVDGAVVQTGPFGSQLHQHDYKDSGTPVVMPQDIVGDRIRMNRIAHVDEQTAIRLSRASTATTRHRVSSTRGHYQACSCGNTSRRVLVWHWLLEDQFAARAASSLTALLPAR